MLLTKKFLNLNFFNLIKLKSKLYFPDIKLINNSLKKIMYSRGIYFLNFEIFRFKNWITFKKTNKKNI